MVVSLPGIATAILIILAKRNSQNRLWALIDLPDDPVPKSATRTSTHRLRKGFTPMPFIA